VAGSPFRLRELNTASRLGLTGLLLVVIGGIAASLAHLYMHLENRDERPGLSMMDIRGAYHGVRAESPLLEAIEAGHPAGLEGIDDADIIPEADRQILLDWLNSDRITEDYDNLDLGDYAPAEIIAVNCLQCHSRNAARDDDLGGELKLDFWDDVKGVAFSREINPTAIEILTISTHTHALSLATLSLVTALLLWWTSWPRWLAGLGIVVIGASLLIDIGSWWLARLYEPFVWAIVLGGAVYNGSTVLASLVVMVDLWLPRRAAG
jgi:mono/diheme cytochrome c family protein